MTIVMTASYYKRKFQSEGTGRKNLPEAPSAVRPIVRLMV